MKKIILLVIFSTITGCGGGTSDFTEDLGHGYIFDHTGPSFKMIRSLHSNQNHIYGTVNYFSHNDEYIIVNQYPNLGAHRAMIGSEIRYQDKIVFNSQMKLGIEESERLADSILLNNPYYQKIFSRKINYWIISHKQKMYGPLSEIEYLKKRKELRVPEELQLDED